MGFKQDSFYSSSSPNFFSFLLPVNQFRVPIVFILLFTALSIHWTENKTSGAPGGTFFKIHLAGDVLFASESKKGIRLFDVSEINAPRSISYIATRGNADVATARTTLFADSYQHMLVFDFSDASHPVLIDTIKNVFTKYSFTETNSSDGSDGVGGFSGCNGCAKSPTITGPEVQTVSNNETMSSSSTGSSAGYDQNKFMSRFIVLENYLYCIDNSDIVVFDITHAKDPVFVKRINIGFSIEMVSLQEKMLFVGGENKKSIFRIDEVLKPTFVSSLNRISSTDPIVVEDARAFTTKRIGGQSSSTENALQVLSVSNASQPQFLGSITIDRPYGLAVDRNFVFVATGAAGVKIIDAHDPQQMTQIGEIGSINVFDVVKRDRIIFAIGAYGIYIFDTADDVKDPIRVATIRAVM